MAGDVRVKMNQNVISLVLALSVCMSSVFCGGGGEDQLGDLFGAIGSMMGGLGAGDRCHFECKNGKKLKLKLFSVECCCNNLFFACLLRPPSA